MKKIFVLDDDQAILDSLQLALEDRGYKVTTSYKGFPISKLKKEKPDLLLLDLWLSGADGREICKQLKLQVSTRDMPVIMISASRNIRQSALEAGADDFIEKPFGMEELLKKIVHWTEKSSSASFN